MKKFFYICLFFVAAVLLFNSCGDLPEEEEAGKTLSYISISPASASLEVGSTQIFDVIAYYTDATISAPQASWTVSGGVGTITSPGSSTLFTATAEGTGTVEATYSGKSAIAGVTVTSSIEPGVLTTIEVSPATALLRVGDSETFQASGINSSGEAAPIQPTWSLSGDPIGTLSAAGEVATLEVNAEGSAMVLAVSGEVEGMAAVTAEGYVVEITVETDTYVDKNNPTIAYGTDTSLKAGYVDTTTEYEAYFYFPLTLIPSGASIESATLRVYPSSAGSSALQLKVLSGSFSNSTTWNTKPTIGSFIATGSFTAGNYNNVSDPLLAQTVQGWNDGASTNYGLVILQEGTVAGTLVMLSLEDGSNPPLLRVEYTTP